MDNAISYYADEDLTIAYNPSMKGYWLVMQGKSSGIYNQFIEEREFKDIQKSDDEGKFSKLKAIDDLFFPKLFSSRVSPAHLSNAIEIVKLKEEKEFAEFKKQENL
jgi:hypothetical protein